MMLRYKLLTAIAPLAIALPGCAHVDAAPAAIVASEATEAARTDDADPALWVIKDEDTTIYLFGTIHVLRPGMTWFDEAVADAFNASDTLVTEAILPDDPTSLQGVIMQLAVDADGPPLSEKIPADKRQAYIDGLAAMGMDYKALESFDPWFVTVQLAQIMMAKNGYNAASGAETTLTAAAKEAGKPTDALETVEGQLAMFDSVDEGEQLAMLIETIEDFDEGAEIMAQMVASWAAGKPEEVGALINEGMKASPQATKILLADRNARWAAWLDERMDAPGTVFMAVGAGHLSGKDSVQDFLARRDIKALRIDY